MGLRSIASGIGGGIALIIAASAQQAAAQDANACPVDGCEVSIVSASRDGDELVVEFEANFEPDLSKNHIHIWWGEQFDTAQVSNNAETTHGVKQGAWHPTDAYPTYRTQSAASLSQREDALSLCVSASDRHHDILDVDVYDCASVEDLVN